MRYRKMPKNGDNLSVLGFGCMRLPQKEGQIDEQRAINQVRYAIDKGVNYIDTAWPYHAGESEPFVGRMLEDGYREKVKLATKLPSWLIKEKKDMEYFLNEQLKRLKTENIDYYLLHTLNGELWNQLLAFDVLEFLEKAVKDGRIVNAGFSFHGKLEDFKKIVDAYPFIFCQIQYNYLDIENEAGREGLHYAAERDLGVIVMEPLRGGLLGNPEQPKAISAIMNQSLSDSLNKRRTPVEWALRWLWDQPEVTLLLSGMNEEHHIDENLDIAENSPPNHLTDAEKKYVEQMGKMYRKIMKVYCTGCGYCKPCPSGVDIPGSFDVYNNFHFNQNLDMAKFSYVARTGGVLRGDPGYASQCIQCGECLEKCPQGIEIPDELEKVKETFETQDLQSVEKVVREYFKVDKKR